MPDEVESQELEETTPRRPESLRDAIVAQLEEQSRLEKAIESRLDREDALLKSIKRRDDEIAKLKARLASSVRTAETRLEQLKVAKKQYRNLSGSKLGRVQRAWWRMRSGKKKPHTDEAKER